MHWIVPILAGVPFGMGVAQILQSLTTYLMDTYGIFFASAIAATVVLRSTCGAVFPLFAPSMFNALGDQWAMSVFAALSTACAPIPLLLWVSVSQISGVSSFPWCHPSSVLFLLLLTDCDANQLECSFFLASLSVEVRMVAQEEITLCV